MRKKVKQHLINFGANLLRHDYQRRQFRKNCLNKIKRNYSKDWREDKKNLLWLVQKRVEDFGAEYGIRQ